MGNSLLCVQRGIMNKRILILGLILTACGGSDGGSSPAPSANATAIPHDMKVSGGTICNKVDTGAGSALLYSYENDTLDSGDHFVTCSVSGSAYQATNVHLYRAGTSSAATAPCQVGYDVDAASGGYWNFIGATPYATATYIDSSSAHNNYQYSFTSSDCGTF